MRKIVSAAIMCAVVSVATSVYVPNVHAEEVKIVGIIARLDLAADGNSAIAILKDNKTGEPESIFVSDELTLDKFKDKRIVEGDEIRTKFEKVDGQNKSKMFKKTAGC
jgi:hypothetical protein